MFAWDMGAFKKISLTGDRVNMQFRARFFNIFNHPMFNNPPTDLRCQLGKIKATLAPEYRLASRRYYFGRATHHSIGAEAGILAVCGKRFWHRLFTA